MISVPAIQKPKLRSALANLLNSLLELLIQPGERPLQAKDKSSSDDNWLTNGIVVCSSTGQDPIVEVIHARSYELSQCITRDIVDLPDQHKDLETDFIAHTFQSTPLLLLSDMLHEDPGTFASLISKTGVARYMTDFLASIAIDWTALSRHEPDAVQNHIQYKSLMIALARLSLTDSGWDALADLALPEVLAQLPLLQPPKQVFLQPATANEKDSPSELFVSSFEAVIRLCYAICAKPRWKRLSFKILDTVHSQSELLSQLMRAEIKCRMMDIVVALVQHIWEHDDLTREVIDQDSVLKELRIQPHVNDLDEKIAHKPYSFVAPNRLYPECARIRSLMADEEHSRSASSYDDDEYFLDGEDNGEDFEGTLDEEEMLDGDADYTDELRELEDEGSMDLEELRRRYGCPLSSDGSPEAECDSSSDVAAVAEVGECEAVDVEPSESAEFFHLPYDELDEGDDADDRDYVPPDPWKRDVRIDAGRYQATVPDSMNDVTPLALSDNDTELPTLPNLAQGGALWMPSQDLSDSNTDRYLADIVELRAAHGQIVSDRYSVTRDDEDALCALYRHSYSIEKAKASFPFSRVNQPFRTVREGALEWDLTERDLFERGIAMYGKNFFVIQRKLLPYRRVGELVEYYYFWKKSERYQLFRKPTVHSEPDVRYSLAPSYHPPCMPYPFDGALPEVSGTKVDNEGVLPDMGSSNDSTSEEQVMDLNPTASSRPITQSVAAQITTGADDAKSERGNIWWTDDVPLAQV
ncbi:unnamed protein product [Angiostrongylus costaricensis]|uniref:SANT domain-containing protein n=1 Tax=Angiostrongylus costaricensis TaxID=334426 RepID=A0A0R3PEP0_ANGCS|nr:unnamed protein product [Angiostrongylus costaricensis]